MSSATITAPELQVKQMDKLVVPQTNLKAHLREREAALDKELDGVTNAVDHQTELRKQLVSGINGVNVEHCHHQCSGGSVEEHSQL